MNNRGVSLASVLITIVIVGIVVCVCITVFIKPKTVETPPTSHAVAEVVKARCEPPLSPEEYASCFPSHDKGL